MKALLIVVLAVSCCVAHNLVFASGDKQGQRVTIDAANFGFRPEASGTENQKALQRAVDQQGTIHVTLPGNYNLAGTVYIGSNTSLVFDNNVYLKKVNEKGLFTHVFLNKGALTKTYDDNITVEGLSIVVNGIDKKFTEVYGLRGQIAFFYVRNLKIREFRCDDLGESQFAIHVCSFEDLVIESVFIKGMKDGIHLGRGKRFSISGGVFETFDDAIALNAHDYATSNPELGWIEDGVIEKCYDLDAKETTGFFCRILAGAWTDWKAGMEVQQSDAVVSNGRLYRVQTQPDGKKYLSKTRPTHGSGSMTLDGINWAVVQDDVTYSAGVRNVTFRDIYLSKPRVSFSIHFDNDKYSRSYYPGAIVPVQEHLSFENIRVLHDSKIHLFSINTPVNLISVKNSFIKNNGIRFHGNGAMADYKTTRVSIAQSVFDFDGELQLITNEVSGKQIILNTSGNTVLHENFSVTLDQRNGTIESSSDLINIKK